MPRALTHIRINWSLSPMASQVPGVIRVPPCAHGVAGTPHGEVRDIHPQQIESMPSSTILIVGHTNSQVAILSWCGIVFSLGHYPHNASSNLAKSQRCRS
jgi:hypothetical protein